MAATGDPDKQSSVGEYRDFDSVTDVMGGFGRYQKLVIFLVMIPAIFPNGFFNYNVVFMAATPDVYGCVLPIENFTVHDLALFAPLERRNGELVPSRCRMYELNYTSETRAHLLEIINRSSVALTTIPCTDGWVYNREVYQSTVVTEWDLVCDRESYASLSFSTSTFGGLFGPFLWAFSADRFGRKQAFFCMLGFQLIFGIATAFAPSLIWFYVFRFCVGMCTSFIYTVGLLMCIELTGKKTRALMSVICSVGYTCSVFAVLGIAYAVRTWRGLALASSTPLLFIFALWKFFPESPRWLLAHKHYDRLEDYVKKVARINGKTLSPKFVADLPEILSQIDDAEFAEKTSLLDLFRTPNLRKKALLLSFVNFCNVGIFSGLNLYAPAFGANPHFNTLLANLVELPPYVFARFICDKAGRRLSLFYPMFLCSAFCLSTVAVSASAATTILALSLCAKFCITLTFLVAELYEDEIFPTVVRGQGHSFTNAVSNLAGVSVPFVVSLGSTFTILPLVIFGCLCTIAAAAALFLPETVGKELPQTLLDGETFGKDMTWKSILTLIPVWIKKRKVEGAEATHPIEPPNTIVLTTKSTDKIQ
ncbi:Carcinine [Hypsibius exemplaris]|uniref:Carcinine n=1 Tax=Hypsibius exemplaris TaxID=2072580 RepID=A0A1W0WHJ6_HYPEX|nr:Carcinine [Hypsibius exemplaris]